jgi:uncharacterized protein (TIGR02996 family)
MFMDPVAILLEALSRAPGDDTAWLALADAQAEGGDEEAAEITCLSLRLRRHLDDPERPTWEHRLGQLLHQGVRVCLPHQVVSLGKEELTLVLIPPGCFRMGSPANEADRLNDEQQHEVEITRAFWLGVHPVTVGQFRAFAQATGYRTQAERESGPTNWQTPGFPQDDNHPVVCVSWNDAQAFCAWLAQSESGRLYRLPTEAEWEYSCRGGAGASHPFHIGQPLTTLSSTQANFNGHSPSGEASKGLYLGRTTPVGSYKPNAWGLFDMHGNVWEWCRDWYKDDYYQHSPNADPPGPLQGFGRVFRGGCWDGDGRLCRSAFRDRGEPADRASSLGFRVSLVLSGE